MIPSIRTMLLTAAVLFVLPASALAASAPGVTTGAAGNLSPDAATVAGSVDPNGQVTSWYFQYGKTKSYGARTTAQDAGSGSKKVPVSSTLTSLANNSTYHYRLVALNATGRTLGADRTFRTPQAPTVSSIAATPNPSYFGQNVTVNGFLVGPHGGPGKQVALEANAFPFTNGFQQVGPTIVTGADGGYSFTFGALLTAQLHVVDRSDPSVVSPVFIENVATRVSLKAKPESRGNIVRFSGHVFPAKATSAVVIQERTKKGGWKNLNVTLPHSKSGASADRWSRRIHVHAHRAVLRAVARPNGGSYIEGISRSAHIKH
jgi:hypothetical protein